MAGWHVDNQPFALATHDPLERVGHNLVMSPRNELRPHLMHEPHERILGFFPLKKPPALLQVLQNLKLARLG